MKKFEYLERQNRAEDFAFPWLGKWYSPPEVQGKLAVSLFITVVG